MLKRRDFIKASALAAGAAVAGRAPYVHSAPKYEWRLVTAWPKGFPGLGAGPDFVAKTINSLSGGRINVKVYPAGTLVKPFECFDAVRDGRAELGHAAAYYWKKKHPATQFFAAVPFGLNSVETSGWLRYGGGQQLWDSLYAEFGLKPFAAGNTGVQMGGWFNKKISSPESFKGLKMRIPGLGGEVLDRLGASSVGLPGGRILPALKSGEIDATEWVGPYNDLAAGFYSAARYYYWPGWHEPGTVIECFINKKLYDSLPADLKAVVEAACTVAYEDMAADYARNNSLALLELVNKHKVRLRRFSDAVLGALGKTSKEVVDSLGKSDKVSRKIYKSYNDYRTNSVGWSQIGEEAYSLARALTFSLANRD